MAGAQQASVQMNLGMAFQAGEEHQRILVGDLGSRLARGRRAEQPEGKTRGCQSPSFDARPRIWVLFNRQQHGERSRRIPQYVSRAMRVIDISRKGDLVARVTARSGVELASGPAGSRLKWLHQESACISWLCFPLSPSSSGRLSCPGRQGRSRPALP